MRTASPLDGASSSPRANDETIGATSDEADARADVPSTESTRVAFGLLFFCVCLLFALSKKYRPFFSDDALIALRYAKRLAEGHGLTWTDGERVEGYTDLLWILLNAPAVHFELDAVLFARSLGFFGAAGALIAVAWSPRTGRISVPRVLGGSSFLATLVPLAIWSIGGLEHAFVAGVLGWALFFSEQLVVSNANARTRWLLGTTLATLVLLRADGLVLVVGSLAALGCALGPSLRTARSMTPAVALPAAAWLGQLVFRLAYYGDFVPNTARAKVSFRVERLVSGLNHLRDGSLPLAIGLVLVVVAACLVPREKRRALFVPFGTSLVWFAYLATAGGDIFPGWRQLLLGVVPLAFVVALGVESFWSRERTKRGWLLLLAPLFVAHVVLQRADAENVRAKTERWEWDGLPLGRTLRRAFASERPLLAVDAAGALPYWSELPALDLLGLNDRYLALHPPPDFGTSAIGHELGDASYYLGRKPDLFAFCNAAGAEKPCFAASRALVRRREFRDLYRPVRIVGVDEKRATGIFHVRLDGRVGAVVGSDELSFPAWFAASPQSENAAEPDAKGRLFVPLDERRRGLVERIRLGPGTWSVETDPPGLAVAFRGNGLDAPPLLDPTLELEDEHVFVDLLVTNENDGDPVSLRRIVLRRAAEPGASRLVTSSPRIGEP